MVPQLNFHHLRYFWVIAQERNLTRAARRLHVSASALSTQLRMLEGELGCALFERTRKSLVLSEAGRVAFEYAETIFRAGGELLDTLFGRRAGRRRVLRVGAVSTLSRNFQLEFIRPALATREVEVVLRSGNLRELLVQLEAYAVDVVLSTEPVAADAERPVQSHRIAEFPVSLVAARSVRVPRVPFPGNLRQVPLVLPGRQSAMRAPFDALLAGAGIRPNLAAEVDDMAMLRLLAREGVGVTLVPPVVVRDELRDGRLREICRVPSLTKTFYALTLERQFANPLVASLITEAARIASEPTREKARRGTRRATGVASPD